jgi:hypothetical protein
VSDIETVRIIAVKVRGFDLPARATIFFDRKALALRGTHLALARRILPKTNA